MTTDRAIVAERNGALDWLRIASAVGIVWFHAHAPGWLTAYAGLTVFLILAASLPALGDKGMPLGAFARQRADRLLRPWLIWSAIYAAAKIVQALASGTSLASEFQVWMLLTGTELHLWFLPYAFVAGVLSLLLVRSLPDGARWSVALAAAAAALPVSTHAALALQAAPFAQWVYGVAPALIGIGIGLAGQGQTADHRTIRLGGVGIAALTGAAAAVALGAAAPDLWPILLGTGLVLAALAFPIPSGRLGARLAPAAMPVYLMHPLVLNLAERSGISALTAVFLGIALPTAAGLILMRYHIGRLLF